MTSLRIIIVGSPQLGGSGVAATRTAEALAKREHNVTFLSYALPQEKRKTLHYEIAKPLEHSLFPFPLQEQALSEHLRSMCLQEKVDVVHAHYALFFGQAVERALDALPPARRPRFVLTCHGTDVIGAVSSDGKSFSANPVLKPLFEKVDVLTTVSKDLQEKIQTLYCVERNIEVIPNFVDLELFTPQKKEPEVQISILHASNFRNIKQTDVVVDAIALLEDSARLLLVGDGPEHERVLRRARKQLGENRVVSLGILNEAGVAKQMKDVAVVFQPSRYESFSLVALEAHACGVPVVGTLSGGMKEIVQNGVTGFLLEPDAKPEAWTKALKSAASLPQICEKARSAAENFSESKSIDAYARVYQNTTSPVSFYEEAFKQSPL